MTFKPSLLLFIENLDNLLDIFYNDDDQGLDAWKNARVYYKIYHRHYADPVQYPEATLLRTRHDIKGNCQFLNIDFVKHFVQDSSDRRIIVPTADHFRLKYGKEPNDTRP